MRGVKVVAIGAPAGESASLRDLVGALSAELSVKTAFGGDSHPIDALFRMIATRHGANAVGVLLDGTHDDGIAGLWHIRRAGGLTIVESPSSYVMTEVPVHYCVPACEIADLITSDVAVPRRPRVLIVEDERVVALHVETKLREVGYDVIGSLANGEDAVAFVERHAPDVVVMDIVLEGELRGTHVARRLWERFKLPSVFLTAYSDERTLRDASIPAGGFVVKPFRTTQLHAALQVSLERARQLTWESARELAFPGRRPG